MAEEERRRRQAKVKAKDDKIQEIAEKREREGAYASASGGVVDPEKSPIKKVLEQRRSFAGRVEAKGEARSPAAKRPLWVAPTAKTPSEGASSEEDEFHSAGETSDRDEGDQSSSGEESEDGRAVIRDVVAGVVTGDERSTISGSGPRYWRASARVANPLNSARGYPWTESRHSAQVAKTPRLSVAALW